MAMAVENPNIPKIRILKKTYERLRNFPLFFFNAVKEWNYSTHEEESFWEPEAIYFRTDIHNRIEHNEITSTTGDILLAYGSLYNDPEHPAESDNVFLSLEQFSPNNKEHVRALLLLYFNKASNRDDQYSFRELLWVFNNYFINMNVITEVLDEFDATSTQPFYWNSFKNLAICLSLKKQAVLQRFLQGKGVAMNLYCPDTLVEAVKTVFPTLEPARENVSIFKLIDIAINAKEHRDLKSEYDSLQDSNISNFFLHLRRWLIDENYILPDISKLATFIRLTTPKTQVNIIRRYFWAVWKKQTTFDVELLKQFQINKFDNWGIYYHCAYEASLPVRLAVPLLSDNILTFLNSGQRALQTINGTLDLAYAKCDSNSPEVDFGMRYIVPLCHGGATPNIANFHGFVYYQVIHSLAEQAFTTENLSNIARNILNQLGQQLCRFKCYSKPDNLRPARFCYSCENKQVEFIDKWNITIHNEEEKKILKLFFNKDFPEGKSVEVSFDEVNLDITTFRIKLIEWLNDVFIPYGESTTINDDGTVINFSNGWVLKEGANYSILRFAKNFISPSCFIVSPRKRAYIGRGVLDSVTGLTSEVRIRLGIYNDDSSTVRERESKAIEPRIASSLAEMVKVRPNAEGVFHVPYNEQLLRQIRSDFYTQKPSNVTEQGRNYPFLTNVNSRYERYCAPKFDNDINLVTQLPYFWCRGKECFRTSLSNQTLSACKSWKEFTILHFLEILGYPQITETSGGNETSELIRSFIGMVNKAESLFKRVRCRECNHILFPIGGSQFNRYNNFECHVPTCGQHRVRVYLSQCHHCKAGLIDSRDSAKCPNGWHICPRCLSCCDDAIYERMANKYVIRHQPIPPRVSEKLGHGHNDKDQFFCPECGGEVVTVKDDHTERYARKCTQCNKLFPDAIDYR